jgi:uncharacterized protein (DUF2252 family)
MANLPWDTHRFEDIDKPLDRMLCKSICRPREANLQRPSPNTHHFTIVDNRQMSRSPRPAAGPVRLNARRYLVAETP